MNKKQSKDKKAFFLAKHIAISHANETYCIFAFVDCWQLTIPRNANHANTFSLFNNKQS